MAEGQKQQLVDLFRVVSMIPIEASIWSRIKGSIDAGYDFTQATTAPPPGPPPPI